jgi:hypothetical protein
MLAIKSGGISPDWCRYVPSMNALSMPMLLAAMEYPMAFVISSGRNSEE